MIDEEVAVNLLAALFDERPDDSAFDWLEDIALNESWMDLLAGVLLLKAVERVAKREWDRRATILNK